MKKSALILLLSSFLFSCGSNEEKQGEEKKEKANKEEAIIEDADTMMNEIKDTLYLNPDYKNLFPSDISAADQKIFKEFFNDSLIAEAITLYSAYDSIMTEKQMFLYYSALNKFKSKASFYLMALKETEDFTKKVLATRDENDTSDDYYFVLDYIQNKLSPIDKYLHGLILTCVAECTEPAYDLTLKNLIEKAKKTKGEDDEKYIQLIIDNFTGDYDPDVLNAAWFDQTWDYGGMSLLGSDKHYAFLKATDKLIDEKNLFFEFIDKFRQDCIYDMCHSSAYAYGKEKIIKELNKILKEIKLNEEQRTGIKTRIKQIENHKGNDSDENGLQLNCETGNCSYG